MTTDLSTQKKTMVEKAAANKNFSTLLAALSADGPFTIVAPTNDAYAKLPTNTE